MLSDGPAPPAQSGDRGEAMFRTEAEAASEAARREVQVRPLHELVRQLAG
jgi:hypothetical protein